MDDLTRFEKLINDGYILTRPALRLADRTPESLENFLRVFPVKIPLSRLVELSNTRTCLIILRHPKTSDVMDILTTDDQAIGRAADQWRYQNEPVGMLVTAECLAQGGRRPNQIVIVREFVESLDGRMGWRTEQGDRCDTFKVKRRFQTTDETTINDAIDGLTRILDCLAILRQVGLYMMNLTRATIPRAGPFITVGPEQANLRRLSNRDVYATLGLLGAPKALAAARAINQSYVENYRSSRLSTLWARVEKLFAGKPERLLDDFEVAKILEGAQSLSQAKCAAVKEALVNPNRLPKKNRNQRIAEQIADLMGISCDEAYHRVRQVTKLRGKLLHEASETVSDDEAATSEEFLHNVLVHFCSREAREKSRNPP